MKNDLRGLKSRSPSADPRVACLTALPGITERISKDLLDRFGSIPNLLRARRKQSEVMEIKGIGRSKAKLILSLRDKV